MLAPEIFCKNFEKGHLAAFDKLDTITARREEIEAKSGAWPDWCALPTGAGYAAISAQHGLRSLPFSLAEDARRIPAAYLWRKSKQIFAFDETVEKELIEQDFPGEIPDDVLLRLPVPCVYIQLHAQSKIFPVDMVADGFFAWLGYNAYTRRKELCLIVLDINGECIDEYVCPMVGTISESIKDFRRSMLAAYLRREDQDPVMLAQMVKNVDNDGEEALTLSKVLNLLLYLCTDEPDYDNQPRRVKAKPAYTTYTPERPPRRTNITNVGTRIGAAIRLDRQKAKELNDEAEQQQQSEHRKHASPIAHIRRGHYHSFWTGARESVDRKIVVKWLPPMLINGDKGEIVPTIRPVK